MKNVKKLLFVFLMAALLVAPFANVSAASKKKVTTTKTTTTVALDENAVTINVFYRTTCPHCQELHEFLAGLKASKEYASKINIVDYEVVTSEENAELMEKVGDYFDFAVDGVPFYVIGEKYYSGYTSSFDDQIKEQIDKLYKDKEANIDVVSGIKNGTITGKYSDNSSKAANNTVGMIILGVSVVIVIVLIVLSSKNKYYDEEDEEEVVKETTKEEVKAEVKEKEKKSETTKKAPNKKNTKKTNKK